jgi:hypothetical protein
MKFLVLAALLALSACSAPAPPAALAGTGPAFDPLTFFTGHVTSWGVEENRAGAPIAVVTTDCRGSMTGPDSIDMVQTLHVGHDPAQRRTWHFTRSGANTFIATANDMSGSATGTVTGREFHWQWVLETSPGAAWKNVTMSQWFYRLDDGNVMIRTVVTKLGIKLLQVSEVFTLASR